MYPRRRHFAERKCQHRRLWLSEISQWREPKNLQNAESVKFNTFISRYQQATKVKQSIFSSRWWSAILKLCISCLSSETQACITWNVSALSETGRYIRWPRWCCPLVSHFEYVPDGTYNVCMFVLFWFHFSPQCCRPTFCVNMWACHCVFYQIKSNQIYSPQVKYTMLQQFFSLHFTWQDSQAITSHLCLPIITKPII